MHESANKECVVNLKLVIKYIALEPMKSILSNVNDVNLIFNVADYF